MLFEVKHTVYYFFVIALLLLSIPRGTVLSATVNELQQQISDKQQQIKQLEIEIAKYESEIGKTQSEAQTLKTSIAQLDAIRRKLQADIAVTQAKIDAVDTTIEKLTLTIESTKESIEVGQSGLSSVVRSLYKTQGRSPVEVFFSNQTLSDAWNEVAVLTTTQNGIQQYVTKLKDAQTSLEKDQAEKEVQKKSLLSLNNKLADQKQITEQNKRSTSQLLSVTKNKEQTFNKLLNERLALKKKIETELFDYESRLKMALDESKLPTTGTGVLAWPLDKIIITQEFGDTAFSRKNALVYSGKGHNGIDLGVSVGTPVYSARRGTVAGFGNTDTGCPGGSYGKWILITHDNGLSTLYAHLSLIKVSQGQIVEDRELIGYSGNTGYSTGPHLHFTVYASQGVKITSLTRSNGTVSSCGSMPVSPLNGYLNPLLYLQSR